MKRTAHLICCMAFLVATSLPAEATAPFSPLRTTTPSGSYTVQLNPKHDEAMVVYDATNGVVSSHSIEALGFTGRERLDHARYTTAGLQWYYPNAVAFFSSDERFYFLHLPWGKTIAFDLSSQDVMKAVPRELESLVRQTLESKALALLESGQQTQEERRQALVTALRLKDADERAAAMRVLSFYQMNTDRETGAMICGQLRLTNSIPRLIALLADDAYTTVGSGDKWRRVYFVRKAARDALAAMGHAVENVVIEEIEDPTSSNKVLEDIGTNAPTSQH